jgi:methionyl-tRNA synthetase
VPANEFLNFQGEKFSKSRGIGIDVQDILKQFDADVVRYFLAANMPEQRDADFNWEEFETKVNNELVATYGNYVHRVLSFTQKNFGEIPELVLKDTENERKEVYDAIILAKNEVDLYLSTCQFKRALKAIMDLSQFGNKFFDSVKPWALLKSDKAKCGSVLNLNMEVVKALAALSWPYLPNSAQKVWRMLGNEEPLGQGSWTMIDVVLQPGTKLDEPKPLFSKVVLEKPVENPFSAMSKLNLKVAKVVSVSDHPNAEKLYVVQLDAGKPVQLVAGLKAYYSKEQLTGKRIVFISNLEPAKLRGVESQGMMLAAEANGKVLVLTPSGDAEPGDAVDSGMGQSDKTLSFDEFKKFTIKVGTIDGGNVDVGSKIPVKLPEKANVPIQAAVLLSSDGKETLALSTAKGVVITVDGEIGNGAQVK